jgi:enterochelin esterase-like enzyme
MPTSIQDHSSSSCDSSGRVEIGRFPSTIDGPDKDYRIYLPPCYGQDARTYPTIYLFHGGAHSDEHWTDLGIDEVVEEMINKGDFPPILIVMPDGGELANDSSGGPRSFEGLFIDELLPFIEANFCAWSEPEGRAIGGISRGGYWALEIAFRNPELIASVGGHSAALLDTDAGPKTNPQETALTNDLRDLRIYLDIGQQDWLINEIQVLHNEMSGAGVQHTWVLNEGQHIEEYWSDHLEEYLEWYAQPWLSDRDSYPLCILESSGAEQR